MSNRIMFLRNAYIESELEVDNDDFNDIDARTQMVEFPDDKGMLNCLEIEATMESINALIMAGIIDRESAKELIREDVDYIYVYTNAE